MTEGREKKECLKTLEEWSKRLSIQGHGGSSRETFLSSIQEKTLTLRKCRSIIRSMPKGEGKEEYLFKYRKVSGWYSDSTKEIESYKRFDVGSNTELCANKKAKVIQSYILTTARYDFSVYEKRILYGIVMCFQSYLKGEKIG